MMAVLERPCCLSGGEDWTAGVSLGVLLTTRWWWPIVDTGTIRRCFRRRGVRFLFYVWWPKNISFSLSLSGFCAGRGGVPAEIGLKFFSPPKFRIYLDQI